MKTAFASQSGAGSSLRHVSHTLIDLSCDQQSVSITHMSFETDSKHNVWGNTGCSNGGGSGNTGHSNDCGRGSTDIARIVKGAMLYVAIARQPNHCIYGNGSAR